MSSTDGEDRVQRSRAPSPPVPGARWRRRLALVALGAGSAAFVLVAAGLTAQAVDGPAARTAVWLATAVVLTAALGLGAACAQVIRARRRCAPPSPYPSPPASAPDAVHPDLTQALTAGQGPSSGPDGHATGDSMDPPPESPCAPTRPGSSRNRRPSTGWSAR